MSRRRRAPLSLPLLLLVAILTACGGSVTELDDAAGQSDDTGSAADEDGDATGDATVTPEQEEDEAEAHAGSRLANSDPDGQADGGAGTSLQRGTTASATSIEVWVHDTLTSLGAELRESDTVVSLPDRVLFEFDEAQVTSEGRDVLDDLAEVLVHLGDVQARVEGHTDSRGAADYNQELSERRAEAVMEHLVAGGVDETRLTATGFGATRPIAPNEADDGADDPDGRAQNRRVEIVLEGVDLDDLAR